MPPEAATASAAGAAPASAPAAAPSRTANIVTAESGKPTIPPPQLRTPTGERLSLAEGLARLKATREPAAKPAEPAAQKAEPPAQSRAQRDPDPIEPEVEDQQRELDPRDAPVDGESQDDETHIEIDDEPKPAPVAALQAPSSYNADEKAAFAALPRPAQEAALRLEQTRRAAFSRDQRAVEDARKSAEASAQQVAAERQFLLNQVAPLLQSLQQAHTSEFSDIRTAADVQRMAKVDPARFAEWQAQQITLQAAQQAQAQLAQQEQAQQAARDREAGAVELRKLSQTVKGWDTPEGLQRGMAELKRYVLSYDGVEEQDFALFRKAPFVEMARKASLYDQAVARKKTAPAPAPQTASPSPGRVASGSALAATNRALGSLQSTGSMDDALAVLRARRGIRQR